MNTYTTAEGHQIFSVQEGTQGLPYTGGLVEE